MLNTAAPCALFFDYDDTLCFGGKVSAENRQALKKVQAAGHKILLNTGRSRACVPPEVLAQIPWDGLIAGVSYVELGGEVLYDEPLSRDCLLMAYEVYRRYGITAHLEGVFRMFSFGSDRFEDVAPDFPRFLDRHYEEMHISKITFWGRLDQPVADGYFPEQTVIEQADYAEVFPKGLDKAHGLKVVAARLGLPREQLLAFGDSYNDIAMLAYAGTGVILPHSPPELNEYAAIRTKNGPTGVAEALTQLFFGSGLCL